MENIIKREKEMLLEAEKKYGKFFKNALSSNQLLQTFIEGIDEKMWIFVAFVSQIRKHHTLALFSTARLHSVQTKMNARQVIEAGVNAAYALANPSQEDFCVLNQDGTLDIPKGLLIKRYKWLEQNYPKHSDFLKRQKVIINKSAAHSNFLYVFKNFKFSEVKKGFETPFFDIEDELHIKTDFWFLGNLAIALINLFFSINQNISPDIKWKDNLIKEAKILEEDNHCIKEEMMQNPRIERWIT